MVAINIHRLSSEATGMDVFVIVACHIAKGGLLNVIGKEINSIKADNRIKSAISDDNNMLKGHVIYIDHFGNVDQH
jgi:S-adenosylmethionine hydrolase